MEINGNFNDLLDGGLDVNVNDMFEDDVKKDKPTAATHDESESVAENEDTNKDKDDVGDINSFFDENIEDTEDNKDKDKDLNKDDSLDPDNTGDDSSSSNSAPSNFTAILAKDLMDQGIISSISDEDFDALVEEKGEAEALRELFKNEADAIKTSVKSDYDENYQEYIGMVENGVDKGTATDLVQTKTSFDSITEDSIDDEDNEDLRRDLMVENYKLTTKFTDAKIKKLVDRSFDLGEDIEESKDALSSIKTIIDERIEDEKVSANTRKAANQKQMEDNMKALRGSIDSINEIIPSQKINKQTKDKMYNLITKPVEGKDGNTTNGLWAKRSEDPIEFDMKLAYLVQTGFFEKGKAWDKIKNVSTTKEANKLEEFLSNGTTRTGRMRVKDSSEEARDMIKSTASILGR